MSPAVCSGLSIVRFWAHVRQICQETSRPYGAYSPPCCTYAEQGLYTNPLSRWKKKEKKNKAEAPWQRGYPWHPWHPRHVAVTCSLRPLEPRGDFDSTRKIYPWYFTWSHVNKSFKSIQPQEDALIDLEAYSFLKRESGSGLLGSSPDTLVSSHRPKTRMRRSIEV